MASNFRYMYTLDVRKILSSTVLKLNCSHHYQTYHHDFKHSSKYQTSSVPMHKPTDEYFGGYETGGGGVLLSFTKLLKLNFKELDL